jgi:Na+:H+ antiporter, NhaA family
MAPSDPLHRRIVRPLQEFLQESTASAVLLVIAAFVAIVWVNSPVGDSYDRLWRTTLTIGSGRWAVSDDLRHWVNDGLMALFFLVVGLEIKREFLSGELRDRRTAALPMIAAVGGMVVPALIYLAINAGGQGARGWGIAMPTDIAFTLGILALASRNAPPGLRSFVLTLAIVDDILTFVVIAIFYPTELDPMPLLVATGLVTAMIVLPRLRIRTPLLYVGLGLGVWLAMNASGVPAALAGVVVGLVTPAVPIPGRRGPVPDDAIAPLARVEHLLLPWTSFVILPLFALANAGVRLSASALADAFHSPVSVGIVVGRIVGKVVGIGLAVWIATRLGVARLPAGTRFAHVVGVAAAAGIAFTVSLFVADLAFVDMPELVDEAKMGILACAPIAGLLGYVLLKAAAGHRYSEPE